MNILQQEDVVKGLPDQVLMQQAQMPTGELPQFLVVSEIQRREKMRKSFAETVPEQSVKDQVLSSGIAAMNPNLDPLMASAMGAQGGQDPMMGQMQDPMQQQMMQDPMQQQMMQQQMMQDPMQQQMMQDPMQQQMPMQDPMMQQMPMQDPMMQQQVMAAGGGMMPYRMFNAGRVPDSFNAPYQSDAPSTHRPAKAQALRAIMRERGVDESLALRIYDLRQQLAVNEQMGAFTAGVGEPYAGNETNTPASVSFGSIPGGLESNNVVNEFATVGDIDGSEVMEFNDGTSRLVESSHPITQSIFGPNLGYAVAEATKGGVDNVIDAGLTAADSAGRVGRAVLEGGGPDDWYKNRETAVGPVVDPELFDSGDVYNVIQELKKAGIDAGEVISRDAEYLSDRGPEVVDAGRAGLEYFADSSIGRALGDAYGVLRTPIPELAGNFFENNPKANLFAAENNTDLLNFIDRTKDSAGSVIDKLRGVTSGLGDVYRNLDTGNDELGYRASWDNGAIKEDTSRVKKKDIDPDLIESVIAPNTGENKDGPADTDRGSTTIINAPETARENALINLGTVSAKDEDTEGLLKGLFGRSYKPTDAGSLALINLGAGIAKGDVGGGIAAAGQAIGESRDRDRKDMLAKAQAEFYASGGRGAKDTLADLTRVAQGRLDKLGANKYGLYKELTGKTDLTNDDLSEVNSYLMRYYINQIANEERVPASAVGIRENMTKREIQRSLSSMSQDLRLTQ